MSGPVSGAVRRISNGEYDAIMSVVDAVDAKGRAADEKWGVGRLPTLVPAEWAGKFRQQQRKFSAAIGQWDYPEALKHGQAMERAYAKLDELAEASGAEKGLPEQWEFEVDGKLVILVKDLRRTNQVELHGREAQVWSLDEIASVIRQHPILAAAKDAFPGATIESVRTGRDVKQKLDDSLEGLPF